MMTVWHCGMLCFGIPCCVMWCNNVSVTTWWLWHCVMCFGILCCVMWCNNVFVMPWRLCDAIWCYVLWSFVVIWNAKMFLWWDECVIQWYFCDVMMAMWCCVLWSFVVLCDAIMFLWSCDVLCDAAWRCCFEWRLVSWRDVMLDWVMALLLLWCHAGFSNSLKTYSLWNQDTLRHQYP